MKKRNRLMNKKMIIILLIVILIIILSSAYFILERQNQNKVAENYIENNNEYIEETEKVENSQSSNSSFTLSSTVGEVMNDKAFEGFGDLIFPVDRNIDTNTSLRDVGSAGARMAAWVGNGTEKYEEKAYPRPAAVIMQYTALTEVTGEEPPTYNCVGTRDGIAPYQTMQERINRIKANGTDAQIEIFEGLPHGFGLGEGTVAEGWIDNKEVFPLKM